MNRGVLKKIILEELQRECGHMPVPAQQEPSKSHSMSPQQGESKMAKGNLWQLTQDSAEVYDLMGDNVDLPEWVEAKLTKAADYVLMVKNYLSYKDVEGEIPQDPEIVVGGS